MTRSWETRERGRGRTTIFNLDGRIVSTGAAGTRCFEDLLHQRGRDAALDAVERASLIRISKDRFPDARGLKTFDVVVEAMLIGAGVPEAQVPEYARRYRQNRETGVDLRPFASR